MCRYSAAPAALVSESALPAKIRRKALTAGFSLFLAAGAILAAPAEDPESPEAPRITSSRMQMKVMDFSDQYVSAMWAVLDEYIRTEPDPAKKVQALAWKVHYGSASMEIAASPDPRTNLLDMAIFITLGKWAVNKHWVPKVFGERARPLAGMYAEQDRKIWKLLADVLTPEQHRSLRSLLAAWQNENPAVHEVANVRLRNLEGVRMGEFDAQTSANGLLASVQRLLGRVDTSLLYGERVMFYMERTPRILSQQTDLTLAQIAVAFPVTTFRPESLPGLSADWPVKLQEGIDRNHALAKDLLPEVRTTLENADRLANTLNVTMQSVREFQASAPALPAISSEDISRNLNEMNAVLTHLDSSLAQVNAILEKDQAGNSKAGELSQILGERADRLIDLIYSRGLILIGAFFCGVIISLIAARVIFLRPRRDGTP